MGSPIVERAHDTHVRARLESAVRRHFPAAADARITHAWSGPLAVPRDWCMSVTFDRDRRFGWAGGYSGHGVVAANIAGRTLADLALGTDSDLTRLPWVNHRSRLWEPEPLRFLASRAIVAVLASADRHEDRTGAAGSAIAPGCALSRTAVTRSKLIGAVGPVPLIGI